MADVSFPVLVSPVNTKEKRARLAGNMDKGSGMKFKGAQKYNCTQLQRQGMA